MTDLVITGTVAGSAGAVTPFSITVHTVKLSSDALLDPNSTLIRDYLVGQMRG